MKPDNPPPKAPRALVEAERYVPDRLQDFIVALETTTHSTQVWKLIVGLGRDLQLPYIDYISASNLRDWRKTLFIRTSYDSNWLQDMNGDPEVGKWSYFRSHAMHYLTPVAIGIEFVEDYRHIPERRVEVLRQAASRGIRAGFSVPLRVHAPPQAALITFSGDHARRDMQAIIRAHGWTLNVAALMAHQRYTQFLAEEFSDRNQITPKQLELIELIGMGLQDKVIADRLGVSVSAVRQRLNALLTRTGLKSRPELAALAMFIGLLPHPFNRPDAPYDTLIEMDNAGTRLSKGDEG